MTESTSATTNSEKKNTEKDIKKNRKIKKIEWNEQERKESLQCKGKQSVNKYNTSSNQ